MSWVAVATAVVGGVAAVSSAKKASDAAKKQSEAISGTAAQSEALNRERYEEAQRLISPSIQRSDIAQQQLFAELGLPVPSQSPYMQQEQALIQQQGAEENIAQTLKDRGIPEKIEEVTSIPGARAGKFGRTPTESQWVTNPEYEAAYQEELVRVRDIAAQPGAPGERTAEMGAPLEGEFLAAPGTGYRGTQGYQNMMGMYDEYGDIIGRPSYEAIKDPLLQYQQMVEGGVDVTQMPGYQDIVKERLSAVSQGAAGAGALYSGRRGEALAQVGGEAQRSFATDYLNRQQGIAGSLSAIESGRMDRYGGLTSARAGTESQFYTNYMNMLQNQANPGAAQNLAALGVNQGLQVGQQNIGAQQAASGVSLQGTQAEGAALADLVSGAGNVASAYMSRPQQQQMYTPQIIPQQQGYSNPNFSPAGGNFSPAAQPNYMEKF